MSVTSIPDIDFIRRRDAFHVDRVGFLVEQGRLVARDRVQAEDFVAVAVAVDSEEVEKITRCIDERIGLAVDVDQVVGKERRIRGGHRIVVNAG